MVTHETKERMALHRKWLGLMAKEFVELPYRQQEETLARMDKFVASCRKAHEESKNIKERMIKLQIVEVGEGYVIKGTAEEIQGTITMQYPYPHAPKIGGKLIVMVYSIDGINWYSSKNRLIKKQG